MAGERGAAAHEFLAEKLLPRICHEFRAPLEVIPVPRHGLASALDEVVRVDGPRDVRPQGQRTLVVAIGSWKAFAILHAYESAKL